MSEDELFELVERVFERQSLGLDSWPDPHPDRQPAEGEYSRVTNAERYRIIGTRADAWAAAAVQLDSPFLSTTSSGPTHPRPTSADHSWSHRRRSEPLLW